MATPHNDGHALEDELNKVSKAQPKIEDDFNPADFTILMVDDDEDQRTYFADFLTQKGFIVFGANTPREGIGIMRKAFVDLIISDLRMPGANGFEFISHLRKNGLTLSAEKIPIILLTSSYENLELEAHQAGANLLCHKKEAETMLVKQIQFLLASKSLQS